MREIKLKPGELDISTKQSVIMVTTELGSSVGMAVYDRKARIAGMAHIVLPDSSISTEYDIENEYGKFADTAIPAILERLLSLGSKKEDLIIKIAGGADMFSLESGSTPFNIGQRNIQAVKESVKNLGLNISGADTGGTTGRTLKLNIIKGKFYKKVGDLPEMEF